MVKPQSQTKNDRPVSDDARSTVREIPAAAEAAREVTIGTFRHWTDDLVGLSVKALAGRDVGPVLSGRAWLDSTFETVERLLTVQRLSVDRLLESQHQIAARLVDSGWALMTAVSGAGLRGRAGEDEDARR